tara:strand:- start:352 stop:708 length:357 start_codon:yes stop_codon:yes gene_type:complete
MNKIVYDQFGIDLYNYNLSDDLIFHIYGYANSPSANYKLYKDINKELNKKFVYKTINELNISEKDKTLIKQLDPSIQDIKDAISNKHHNDEVKLYLIMLLPLGTRLHIRRAFAERGLI